MEFQKYVSIENDYNKKEYEGILERNQELYNCKYIVQEKIHGANFSIYITKDTVHYAKRTDFIKVDESFYNWREAVNRDNIKTVINRMQQFVNLYKLDSVILYGELYGDKIQHGVSYSPETNIKFFDMKVNGGYIGQDDFIHIFNLLYLQNEIVPIIGIYDSLEKALSIDTKFNSILGGKDKINNICEGIVIKPYELPEYTIKSGRMFYLKKKNSAFSEKKRIKKKVSIEPTDKGKQLKEIFMGYVNENRIQSVFSKYGEISSYSQIPDYCQNIYNDAKEDFLKEYKDEIILLNSNDNKHVFNIKGYINALLRDILQKK